jgi:hypothetical protein
MNRHRLDKRHFLAAVFALTALFLAASTFREPIGFVAGFNHSAHGVIDYCTLSGTTTTIHGWAHDPDTPNGNNPTVTIKVGGLSATVKTSIAGYHDTAINKYLEANWPSAPKGSIYGFTASFSTLYKGSSYTVSGVANNAGADGSNTNMPIDTTASDPDGISANYRFTTSKTLPDACLVTKPAAAPPPPPAPTPTPTPSPTPTPTQSSGGSSGSSSHTSQAVPASPMSAADASVASGTLTAVITAPADTASSVMVAYGTANDSLDYSSDATDASSGTAIITLVNLTPKTQYFYQLVRTDASGNTVTSAVSDFTTAGYLASLHFIDDKGKAVAGIHGAISDANKTAAVSDKNGDMTFAGLDDGQYTVTFHYGKLNYTRQFNTETAGDGSASPSNVITLKDIVNVSRLTGGKTGGYTGPTHGSPWPVIIIVIIVLAAIAGGVVWWLRRRKAGVSVGFRPPNGDYALATLPSATSPLPPKKIKHRKKQAETQHLEHVGESLRDMVLKSMHEEAQKRKNNPPK